MLRKFVPTRIRRSYAAKFGIALLVLALAVGLIGTAGTVQIRDSVQDGVNERYGTLASQEARNLESWIEQRRLTAMMIGQSSAVKGGNEREIEAYFTIWNTEMEGVHGMHYIDQSTDEVLVSTDPLVANASVSELDVPWQSIAAGDREISGGTYMSKAYATQAGKPLVAFAVPVQWQTGQRLVVLTFELDQISTQVLQGSSTEGFVLVANSTSRTIVMDSENKQFFDTYRDGPRGEDPIQMAADADRPENRIHGMTVSAANSVGDRTSAETYVVGHAPIEGTDWVVLVHRDSEAAYAFVSEVARFGRWATLSGVLLIGLIGLALGRQTATAIDRLTTKTARMEEGNLDVDLETKRIDNIGRLYNAFDSMRNSLRDNIQEIQRARDEAEQSRQLAESMNVHLEEKADQYRAVMQACADGDLTRRMDPESDNRAMSEIGSEFNEMMDQIERAMERVKDFAHEVATASEEVTASSEEVKNASEQVTESIQEISDGATRQNESLQSVSEEMNGLSTTVEEIASSANEVAEVAERTAETGSAATEDAERAIDRMTAIEREAEDTVEEITQLQAQMDRIEEIAEFITEVAEQTNVLALNANIEASRAADSGEGFAVVAEEVKDLAEDTREAAEEIEEIIDDIHAQTERTAEEVRQTSEEVGASTDAVESTVDALEEIAGYAEETNTGVQEISAATQQQASSTNQVVAMVDEAATISEETTAESQKVAAAAEEQTVALTEVSDSADDLARQASRLSDTLDRFDTDVEVGALVDEPAEDSAGDGPEQPVGGELEWKSEFADADADGFDLADADADDLGFADADADDLGFADADVEAAIGGFGESEESDEDFVFAGDDAEGAGDGEHDLTPETVDAEDLEDLEYNDLRHLASYFDDISGNASKEEIRTDLREALGGE